MFLATKRVSGSSGYGSGGMLDGIDPLILIIAAVVSLIVAIIIFVAIVERKKAPRGRFTRWLREYLNFRSILISKIIKFVYVLSSIFLTIMSVVVMCSGKGDTVLMMILVGLAMLILGNILLRIMTEMTMALIAMWENTSDIRGVLVKDEEAPEEREPKEEPKEKEVEKKESVAEEVAVERRQAAAPQRPVAARPVAPRPDVVRPDVVRPSRAPQPGVSQPDAGQPGVNQ